MYIGSQRPSGSSTESRALALLKSVLESFRLHPYFYMLDKSTRSVEPLEPYAHQLDLLIRVTPRRPVRVLVGDEIGLGKTIEAILIMEHLFEAGYASKALVLVPRSLVKQWLSELKRLGIEAVEVSRKNIEGYGSRGFGRGVYVASIDFAKREGNRDILLKASWDLVVVDEAHRVGLIGGRESLRYRFVEELARNANISLILLSATPHRGKPEDYIARLKLLDPYIRASAKELDMPEFYRLINGVLVFRRTKADVNDIYEKRSVFPPCRFIAKVVGARYEEKEFQSRLVEFLRSKILDYYSREGAEPRALPLLLILIAKRASSSPLAALKTMNRIIARRAGTIETQDLDREAEEIADLVLGSEGFEDYGELSETVGVEDIDEAINSFAEKCSSLLSDSDVEVLKRLYTIAREIAQKGDSRLNAVESLTIERLNRGDRVVVFTEFKDTAEFIYERLSSTLKGKRIALVTGSEIRLPECPGLQRVGSPDIEDVKKWLRKGCIDVIVSTDVASEGLNLQQANVVVHYEPPWSPIKIVQRIGRVWRLGQTRETYSYTILLDVESDRAVLEVLYAKLLSWLVAGVESRISVGEELEIDMLSSKGAEGGSSVSYKAGDREGQYSEYRAWIEYIARGRAGLEEYIGKIIEILRRLREEAEKAWTREHMHKKVSAEFVLDEVLGGLYGGRAREAMLRLVTAVLRAKGYRGERRGGRLYAGQYIIDVNDPYDIYRNLKDIFRNIGDQGSKPVILSRASYGDLSEVHIYRVEYISAGKAFYSEAIAMGVDRSGRSKILRGPELFEILAASLESLEAVADDLVGPRSQPIATNEVKKILLEYADAIRNLEKRGVSLEHRGWVPRDIAKDLRISPEYLGSIVFIKPLEGGSSPPPEYRQAIEQAAMEYAMEYERKSGRIPEDVSSKEHYDIKSTDPVSGEVRLIEVKGRRGEDIAVELTEQEYMVGKENGDRYWLYIVYGISSGRPRMVVIRDPINSLRWAVVGPVRYRMVGAIRDEAT